MSKAQELADKLQAGADDPMWDRHTEMSKLTCKNAAEELRRLDVLRAELADCLKECMWAVEVFHGPVAWDIYRDHSPEMKRWIAALSSSGGNES